MRLSSKFALALVILISFNLKASVWDDTQSWSLQYEEEYDNWIQSSAVNETMFNDSRSAYFGVNTDCADTAYALRAIFAFEHSLPFAIYRPSGSRGTNKTMNNRQGSWDRLPTNKARLIAMINDISDSVGTENLAHFDTFPVAIKSITPGSIFMYKIKARFGRFIRHTYIIKNINDVGTFDVIYSTQANKAKGLSLIRRKDYEFSQLPSAPWGFKKFKWPEHLGLDLSVVPKELGPSTEQFTLAQTLGTDQFFKFVRKSVANTNESSGERMARLFKTVCTESQARIDYVNQAMIHLSETNNKCMNYEEFDAYSTPARDLSLKEIFEKLKGSYNDLVNEGSLGTISPQLLEFAEIIFKNKSVSNTDLLTACPINYAANKSIDLRQLWVRIEKELVSSHPNDALANRWGETKKGATRCKRWY